jgi:hypothetical protein
MYSFALLEPECYYLLQLNENDPLTLAQVKVVSDHCMYIIKYEDTMVLEWVKKTEPIHDIIELLSDDVAQQWLKVYNSSEDAYNYEEGED